MIVQPLGLLGFRCIAPPVNLVTRRAGGSVDHGTAVWVAGSHEQVPGVLGSRADLVGATVASIGLEGVDGRIPGLDQGLVRGQLTAGTLDVNGHASGCAVAIWQSHAEGFLVALTADGGRPLTIRRGEDYRDHQKRILQTDFTARSKPFITAGVPKLLWSTMALCVAANTMYQSSL